MFLLFFFGKGLDDSGEGATGALESGDDIACRRLEESDDVSDEVFLRLDRYEFVKLVRSDKCAFLYVGRLECRLLRTGFLILLDKLGGNCRGLGVHDGSVAFEGREEELEFGVAEVGEHLVEKSVLHDGELDSLLEALATESRSLLGVESGYVGDVEIGAGLQLG